MNNDYNELYHRLLIEYADNGLNHVGDELCRVLDDVGGEVNARAVTTLKQASDRIR